MKSVKFVITTFLATLLCACQSVAKLTGEQTIDATELMAVVTQFEAEAGHLHFTTLSNGCTFIDSFKLKVVDAERNIIKIIRVKPDLCRMGKRQVSLQYSYKHLGLKSKTEVVLANRLAATGP